LGMDDNEAVRLERDGVEWQLACVEATLVADANAYLGYLADRNYSPERSAPTDMAFSRSLAGSTRRG